MAAFFFFRDFRVNRKALPSHRCLPAACVRNVLRACSHAVSVSSPSQTRPGALAHRNTASFPKNQACSRLTFPPLFSLVSRFSKDFFLTGWTNWPAQVLMTENNTLLADHAVRSLIHAKIGRA